VKRKDEEIKMDVVDQLYWNDKVDTSSITVASSNGVVTLSGEVPSYAAKRSAVEEVNSIPGVTRIENRLAVTASNEETVPTDDSIAIAIEALFSRTIISIPGRSRYRSGKVKSRSWAKSTPIGKWSGLKNRPAQLTA